MELVKKVNTTIEEQTKVVKNLARRSWLASLGVAGMAKDTAEARIEAFIKRGEKVEELGRTQVNKLRKRIDSERAELTEDATEARKTVVDRLDTLLGKLNVPTQKDMAVLDHRLAELATQMKDLTAADLEADTDTAEPIEGYAKLRADDVVGLLPQLTHEQLVAIREYEAAHNKRVTVLRETDRLLNTKFHEQVVA